MTRRDLVEGARAWLFGAWVIVALLGKAHNWQLHAPAAIAFVGGWIVYPPVYLRIVIQYLAIRLEELGQ